MKRNVLMQRFSNRIALLSLPLLALPLLALTGCGGGGGGDALPDVAAGPPPAGTTPPPAPLVPSLTVAADEIAATSNVASEIVGISLGSPVTVTFSLMVDELLIVRDLSSRHVRFTFSRLVPGAANEDSLEWRSLINTEEDPICRSQADVDNGSNSCTTFTLETDPALIPDDARKVHDPFAVGKVARTQATYERGGVLTDNSDGTYAYTLAADPGEPESLSTVHRVCMQFSLPAPAGNPCIDFVPADLADPSVGELATSLAPGFYASYPSRQIVATQTCNTCHDGLGLHGGGRVEMDYCVTCHNPGSGDANSGHSVDFAEMIHKIHLGRNLPSVRNGVPYRIWGYRNSLHDYSNVGYPQDVRNCTRCHAGQADADSALAAGFGVPYAYVTADGGNWASQPSARACGSCHEDSDEDSDEGGGHFAEHSGRCADCHVQGGEAGSVRDSHRDPIEAAASRFAYRIESVSGTAPGEFPVIDFRVVDPASNDSPYDILNDPPFVQPAGASRLALTVAWSTSDYTNTGNQSDNASAVSINALATAAANGDGSFRVVSPVAVPDGRLAPLVPATGSGAVTMEGHPAVEVGSDDPEVERIPVPSTIAYFSIDEAGGAAVPRRQVVELAKCQSCHRSLVLHGDNRTDNIDVCLTCHNPRNTDRRVREVARTPPTDGKVEESIHFKTMIHAIHGSGIRENPLQIVGFRGFATHVYDEEEVRYPGRVENCLGCHREGTYTLPLPPGVLGTTVGTGDDRADPADDVLISPVAATCSSCHDSAVAIAHMQSNGADFATSQAFLDSGAVLEQCVLCHGSGAIADIDDVHGLP